MLNKMTVTVGKKTLILGWEVAVVVALFLLGIGWKSAVFFDGLIENQREMERNEMVWMKNDSLYYKKTDQVISDFEAFKRGSGEVTEVKINGRTYFKPIPNSNNNN